MLCLAGCKPAEEPSEPPRGTMPSLPERDASPRAPLAAAERVCEQLLEREQELQEKVRDRLPSADEAAVKAALAADPEWRRLERELAAAEARLEQVRRSAGGRISK